MRGPVSGSHRLGQAGYGFFGVPGVGVTRTNPGLVSASVKSLSAPTKRRFDRSGTTFAASLTAFSVLSGASAGFGLSAPALGASPRRPAGVGGASPGTGGGGGG